MTYCASMSRIRAPRAGFQAAVVRSCGYRIIPGKGSERLLIFEFLPQSILC